MKKVEKPLPELIFGLVGPVGCNIHEVQQALCSALKAVDYTPHKISLSKNIAQLISILDPDSAEPKTINSKIDAGNKVRAEYGHDAVLAAAAINEIREIRKLETEDSTVEDAAAPILDAHAYIIRQLKRKEEIELLHSIYGRRFIQVSITQDKQSRLSELKRRFRKEQPDLSEVEITQSANNLMHRDENEGGNTHGQRVEDIFHLGDVFIDASSSDSITATTQRFVQALFGNTAIAPSRDEFGTYLAKATSLRSVDLSRQVGAAITSKNGDIISLGCNEVPKPDGGNYWDDDKEKSRDVDRKGETNKPETNRIIFDFLRVLKKAKVVDLSPDDIIEMKDFQDSLKDSLISDITEYGRVVHAEMNALMDAARMGRSVMGATIHVTTFPCHNCAKHIIAAGIRRIRYIEPYPKSRTLTLYEDAISEEGESCNRVSVGHFSGISPRRYRDIFEKGKRRGKDGDVNEFYRGRPEPMINIVTIDYRSAEREIVEPLLKRALSVS